MIALYLHQGYSITNIAMLLHRNYSTIYREIKRNGSVRVYDDEKAGSRARKRWKLSHKKERISCYFLRLYITIQLHQGWSPEQIAGRLSLDYPS